MNLLAIDTSTDLATVAVSFGDDIWTAEQSGARKHAQFLLPMIQQVMHERPVAWSELQGIVYDEGPGSFTGLRVACSIAKALAYAHNLPIYGVSSLQSIAWQIRKQLPQSDLGILACGDARMNEIYWAYYPPNEGLNQALIRVDPVHAVQIQTARPLVLAGWGLESHRLGWLSDLQTQISAEYPIIPTAESLIELVQSGLCSATTATAALPLYVRNQVTHTGETHG